ncbi:MAG: corrinoid protein [Thermodesulfobacteriota bacterium]|nr:corrinoid protein [Thermodesulfobacteriota bacterium]
MDYYKEIHKQLEEGEEDEVVKLVKECLNQKKDPQEIIQKGLIFSMEAIGVKFRNGDMFFPEVLLSATCFQAGMDVLKPYLAKEDIKDKGIFLIGTVADDIHDIGKNLVALNLKAAGYNVIDIGVEVSPEGFVEAIKKHKPNIVGMSALLTTTMVHMKEIIEAIDAQGLRKANKLKIVIGGAPVEREFADEIGADYYGSDAMEAITIAGEIMQLREK